MRHWVWACLVAGCAGSAIEPDPSPAAKPSAASGSSSSTSDREARQEVLQAEAERKAEAFRSRLSRLRAEEEARAQARAEAERKARTGTVAMARTLSSLTKRDPLAEPGPAPKPAPEARPEPLVAASPQAGDPTPAAWLRAGRCLEAEELVAVQKRMAEARHAGKPREVQARWALALVETQGLLDDVQAELAHRGLANGNASCASSDPAVGLLRSLYGRGAKGGSKAGEVVRAAQRLRNQLEIRAGLPRPTYEP